MPWEAKHEPLELLAGSHADAGYVCSAEHENHETPSTSVGISRLKGVKAFSELVSVRDNTQAGSGWQQVVCVCCAPPGSRNILEHMLSVFLN